MKFEYFGARKARATFGPTLSHSEAAEEFGISSIALSNKLTADATAPKPAACGARNSKSQRYYVAAVIRAWWGARKT